MPLSEGLPGQVCRSQSGAHGGTDLGSRETKPAYDELAGPLSSPARSYDDDAFHGEA